MKTLNEWMSSISEADVYTQIVDFAAALGISIDLVKLKSISKPMPSKNSASMDGVPFKFRKYDILVTDNIKRTKGTKFDIKTFLPAEPNATKVLKQIIDKSSGAQNLRDNLSALQGGKFTVEASTATHICIKWKGSASERYLHVIFK